NIPKRTFLASVNVSEQEPSKTLPFFWKDPNAENRTFKDTINYTALSDDCKKFIGLFYESADLQMKLVKGYRGRPSVGSITLISDLKRTANTPGKGLQEMLNAIRTQLKSDAARVFVFGSVFGGTGAAGLPIVPELIGAEFGDKTDSEKLRFGCAMMAPYFTFPPGSDDIEGPTPDSGLHQVATQAALLHYSHVPPGYQHVYIVGAPQLYESPVGHQAGGEEQENDPHYAEIIAALAARDFLGMASIRLDEQ